MAADPVYPTVYMRDRFVPFKEANLSIASAPVQYGLSVYTVVPAFWNEERGELYLFRLEDHFRRLKNSAGIVGFDDFLRDWDYERFARMLKQLFKQNGVQTDSLVRVNVFVDEVLTGTRTRGLKHRLSAFVYPLGSPLPARGARLGVSSWRRTPDNALPARAKINGSYANAALMKNEALEQGFDDAIALDERGHVAESTVANIFLVRGGRLISPGDSNDLLEGVTRDTIFRLAAHLGIEHEKRAVDRSELYLADEIFLSGSSVGITPVTAVDHRAVGDGKPGPLTKRLRQAYAQCARRRTDDFADWTTPVS